MQSGPQNNRTITRTKELPKRKVCSVPLLTDPCCGFNYTRCQADPEYFQPFCVKAADPIPEPDTSCVGLNLKSKFTLTSIAAGEKISLPAKFDVDCLTLPYYIAATSDVGVELAGYLAFIQGLIPAFNATGIISGDTMELSLDYTAAPEQYLMSCNNAIKICILNALDELIDGRIIYDTPTGIYGRGICCAATEVDCTVPQGYMEFEVTVIDIIPAHTIVGFTSDSLPCTLDNLIMQYEIPLGTYTTQDIVQQLAVNWSSPFVTVIIDGATLRIQLLESFFTGSSPFASTVYCGAPMRICGFASGNEAVSDAVLETWFNTVRESENLILTCCPIISLEEESIVGEITQCPPCGPEANVGCGETDQLYFQFQFPDEFNDFRNNVYTHHWSATKTGNWLATVEVLSPFCCDVTYNEYVTRAFVGWQQSNDKTYQQIIIDTTNLPPVFELKFTFNLGDGATATLYTEPYMRTTCENTFVIEGVYPPVGVYNTDCDDNYYGFFTTTDGDQFPYRNIRRVRGSFEFDGYTIERETLNQRTVKVINEEQWLLRTAKIPVYVNDYVRLALQAERTYINGQTFLFSGEVAKGIEVGSMWLLNLKMKRADPDCYIKYFNC